MVSPETIAGGVWGLVPEYLCFSNARRNLSGFLRISSETLFVVAWGPSWRYLDWPQAVSMNVSSSISADANHHSRR